LAGSLLHIELKPKPPIDAREWTVAAVAECYLADPIVRGRLAIRTFDLREQTLRGHVVPSLGGETPFPVVTVRDLRRMIIELERKGLAGSAIRNCVSATAAVFGYAIRVLEVVEQNPARELERGDVPSAQRASEPRYLSRAEVSRLLDCLTPSFRPLAAACYFAGLRISEALGLCWRDVDFEQRMVRVPGSKTRSSRATVPLADALAEELRRHRLREEGAGRFDEHGLVFRTRGGRSPGRRNAHRAVARAAVKAGLVPPGAEPVGVHDLRHSFASMLLENGMSLAETSRLLRHSNVAVTATIYAGLSDAALARLGDRLNQITTSTEPRGSVRAGRD
jgi:integrase